jgi:hypothetical protein
MKTILASLLFFAAASSHSANLDVSVRLAEVTGSVWARTSAEAQWVPVKDGVMLAPGSTLKTGVRASVVLAFSDNNKVQLGPKTTFTVEGASTLTTELRLFSGRLQAWVKRVNKADFIVRHPAGVAAVRGTIFGMESGDAGVKIDLFEGALDIVDNFGRPSNMGAGQAAQISAKEGIQGIASLPPAAKAPPEPKVQAPPPPTTVAPPPKNAPLPPKMAGPPPPGVLPPLGVLPPPLPPPPSSTLQEQIIGGSVISPSSP